MSAGLITRSISSTSGSTATVAADVCTLPWVSVSGTRCTRCTPASNFSVPKISRPSTFTMISLYPPAVPSVISMISCFHFIVSKNLLYMRYKSPAKMLASSPPAPARISTIAFLSSSGSFGIRSNFIFSSKGICLGTRDSNSSLAISFISGSLLSSISLASARLLSKLLYSK